MKSIVFYSFFALLIASAVATSSGNNDFSTLPSREASMVIPLLAKLHHRDDSLKTVARALGNILGKPDHEGKDIRHRYYMEYRLNDNTKVTAVFLDGQFVMIMAPTPNDPDRTFYTEPERG